MNPKISIITPCFNAEKYIEQTILSIINQGYDNLEYIIIDGGSTDGTVDIIKKYEDKITYWISEPDNGQSDAINKGIKVATGEVFNWVNADDYLEKNALNLVGDFFKNDSINVVCTPTMLFNENGNIRINDYTPIEKGVFGLLNYHGLNQQGMFWKLSIIKDLNGVNTNFNYSMDLDLWKRYLINYKLKNVVISNELTGYFRMSNESKTGADFETNFHLFEAENHAAIIQYSKLLGESYTEILKLIYPKYKLELVEKSIHSSLNIENLKNWIDNLIYQFIKDKFYQNEFKMVLNLLKNIDFTQFDKSRIKDLRYFKRNSIFKSLFR